MHTPIIHAVQTCGATEQFHMSKRITAIMDREAEDRAEERKRFARQKKILLSKRDSDVPLPKPVYDARKLVEIRERKSRKYRIQTSDGHEGDPVTAEENAMYIPAYDEMYELQRKLDVGGYVTPDLVGPTKRRIRELHAFVQDVDARRMLDNQHRRSAAAMESRAQLASETPEQTYARWEAHRASREVTPDQRRIQREQQFKTAEAALQELKAMYDAALRGFDSPDPKAQRTSLLRVGKLMEMIADAETELRRAQDALDAALGARKKKLQRPRSRSTRKRRASKSPHRRRR